VPWVNGVKWRKANGLERLKPKDKRVRFNGAAMAGPPNQKKRDIKYHNVLGQTKIKRSVTSPILLLF
jgi:hypothetical protein